MLRKKLSWMEAACIDIMKWQNTNSSSNKSNEVLEFSTTIDKCLEGMLVI